MVEVSNFYNYANLIVFVLKGYTMMGHHIGLNQLHPDYILIVGYFCLPLQEKKKIL